MDIPTTRDSILYSSLCKHLRESIPRGMEGIDSHVASTERYVVHHKGACLLPGK